MMSMDQFFEDIDAVHSLEEASVFAQDDKLKECVTLFLQSSSPEARRKCARAIKALKNRLHPVLSSPGATEVLRKHAAAKSDEERRDLQAQYIRYSQELLNQSSSEQGALYAKVIGLLDRQLAPVLAVDHGAGRSNRARRAKVASNVFTRNAGLSSGGKEQGNSRRSTDSYGNMVGSDWDLGRDGAYDGLKVVILQEYSSWDFTGGLPVKALQDKGFEVVHKFARSTSEQPSVSYLDAELENASQVWLISGSFEILSEELLNVIVNYWKQGLGVYIFGDNHPFYADANRLLAMMKDRLTESYSNVSGLPNSPLSLQLQGNTPGRQIVRARRSAGDSGPGFVPNHLLVTGIVALYEGVTVSSIEKNSALEFGFEEVLREHDGHLVVVAREAMDGCGPIIVDGAFTKLYCHWQEGGSSRFVRSCACWLSTILDKEAAEAATAAAAEEPGKPPELDLSGAFSTECSITLETGPTALLASQLADMEQNTTDFSLDNNLALARRNMVLGSQPLNVDVAKLFLQQGQNPFTREPVPAILPLVSLSNNDNLKLVSEIANNLFMGGRSMNRHSLNILLSVLEEMTHKEPDCPEALSFFVKEILRNAVSTPDMLKGVPGGPTVPLEQGLRNNITMTGEFVPLRKAFPHVARLVRLLATYASEPARLPVGKLRQVARRSLLKTIIGAAGRFAKLESSQADGKLGDGLKDELDQVLFDTQLGIPIGGTAKLIELPALGKIVNEVLQHTTMDEITEDAKRVASAIGATDDIVSPSELTLVMVLMRARSGDLWKILIEPLLIELKKKEALFSQIWDAASETDEAITVNTTLQLANEQLTGAFKTEPAEHARVPWPGFVSPLGPSVYRCKCGFVFGNPEDELTNDTVEKMKQTRSEHFQKMFGADFHGYPTNTSVHSPLHRAVQRVLTLNQFCYETERNDAMESAVAKYLQKKQRGNIHVPTIRSDIQFAADTYLECRKKGMKEPAHSEPIDFLKKAKLEQELILESRAKGGAPWVDPQRPVSN